MYRSTFYFELLVCRTLPWSFTFSDASWRECRTKSYNKDSQWPLENVAKSTHWERTLTSQTYRH